MDQDHTGQVHLKISIIKAVIIGFAFIMLTFFYYHIDKLSPWWFLIIIQIVIAGLFIAIVINSIKQIIGIIKQRKSLSLMVFLPLVIYLFVVILPFGSSERLESDVKFRACYEGTQNQAYIKLRNDKTFELHWTGVFFYNDWTTGKWEREGNKLTLNYDGKVTAVLGRNLLIDSGYLVPQDKEVIAKEKGIKRFYIGYCKGEN